MPRPTAVSPSEADARDCLRDRLCDADGELIALAGGAVPAPCTYRQLTALAETLSRVVSAVTNASANACVVGILSDEGPLTPVVECSCLFSKLLRFVPLDPTFPSSRLLYQLRNSNATCVVTTRTYFDAHFASDSSLLRQWLSLDARHVVLVLFFAGAVEFAEVEARGEVVRLSSGQRACDASSVELSESSLPCGIDLRRSQVSRSAAPPVPFDRVLEESSKEGTGSTCLSRCSFTVDSLLGAVGESRRHHAENAAANAGAGGDVGGGDGPKSDTGELYLIYTSGTTGAPKAVVGRCAALLCYLASPVLARSPTDRVLLCSATTWDPSISDIYGTLTQGATLVLEPRARLMSDLVGCIDDNRVSHVLATPALWRLAMANRRRRPAGGEDGAGGTAFLPSLRVLQLGGESWHAAEVLATGVRPSGLERLHNVYGVTECTVYQAVSANLCT